MPHVRWVWCSWKFVYSTSEECVDFPRLVRELPMIGGCNRAERRRYVPDEFSDVHDCSAVFVSVVGDCRDICAWCYRDEPPFSFFCFYYGEGREWLCAVIFESFMNVPCSVTIAGVEYGGDKLRREDRFDFPGVGVFLPYFTIRFVGGDEMVDVPCDGMDDVVRFLDSFPSADSFFLRQPYFEGAAGDLFLL